MRVSGLCQNRGTIGSVVMQIRCAAPSSAKTPKAAPAAKPPVGTEAKHVQLPAMKVKQSYREFRKDGAKRTRVLKLRGGEELLFQFGEEEEGGTAWRHAEHVGTVSVLQQWIAVKKLVRDDYDVSKANHKYKMWGDSAELQGSQSSSEADESEASSSSNGAAPKDVQNGNGRLPSDVSPEKAKEIEEQLRNSTRSSGFPQESPMADYDGSLWHQEGKSEQQVYGAVHDEFEVPEPAGHSRRFRAFGAPGEQPEPLLSTSKAGKQKAAKQRAPKKKAANKAQQTTAQQAEVQQLSNQAGKPSKASKPQKDASMHLITDAMKAFEPDWMTYPEDGGWTVLYETLMPESGLTDQSDEIDEEEEEEEEEDYSLEEQLDEAEDGQTVALRSVEDVILRSADMRVPLQEPEEEQEEEGEGYNPREDPVLQKMLQHSERQDRKEATLGSSAEEQPMAAVPLRASAAEPEASSNSTAKAQQTWSRRMTARLERAARQFLAFWRDRIAGLVSGARSLVSTAVRAAQVAFWAALYLLRRAQWAVLGQPRPPKVHASPTVALLCERADKEEAKQLSIQHGYDFNGKKAKPLEDLPRWRVEMLVGTFVVDMSLYRRALTAPSAVPDSRAASSYERLEYLGDSILEGIARQFIYERWPDATEHAMCAMVSGLVSGRTLHDFAHGLHMERYLALRLDAQWSAKHLLGWADGLLADCFEALLGALFLDRGHRAARNFMLRAIEEFVELERLPYNRDYKGILGNVLAIRKMGRPSYRCRLGTVPGGEAQKHLLVPGNGAGAGSDAVLWEAQVQVKGPGAAPAVLSRAYDIHRNTAEQQAARAALQSMGLQMQELNLVEADQTTMKKIAGRMPGLTTLKEDLNEAAGKPRKSGKGSK